MLLLTPSPFSHPAHSERFTGPWNLPPGVSQVRLLLVRPCAVALDQALEVQSLWISAVVVSPSSPSQPEGSLWNTNLITFMSYWESFSVFPLRWGKVQQPLNKTYKTVHEFLLGAFIFPPTSLIFLSLSVPPAWDMSLLSIFYRFLKCVIAPKIRFSSSRLPECPLVTSVIIPHCALCWLVSTFKPWDCQYFCPCSIAKGHK